MASGTFHRTFHRTLHVELSIMNVRSNVRSNVRWQHGLVAVQAVASRLGAHTDAGTAAAVAGAVGEISLKVLVMAYMAYMPLYLWPI